MAPLPGYRNLTISDETTQLVDQLRRQIEEIPTRPALIHWALEYAVQHEAAFLRFVEKRQRED